MFLAISSSFYIAAIYAASIKTSPGTRIGASTRDKFGSLKDNE